MKAFLTAFLTVLTSAAMAQNTAGWGNTAAEEKPFSLTDPLFPGFWMAWTYPTAMIFVGIFTAMGILTVIEIRHPGGAERKGVFGLVTTRGDRLFITLLGSVYIFLAWLGLVGMPLWIPCGLAVAWGVFCFWKV